MQLDIDPATEPSLWVRLDRITAPARGRWVISWQAYVVGAVLHVVLVGVTGGSVGAEPIPVSETPYWLTLAILASGLVGAYALLVNYTIFRHKRTQLMPLWQATAFHVGVGCIFFLTLLNGERLFPVSPIEGPAAFAIATVAIGVWFGFTMSFLLAARDTYQLTRSELIEQSVALELASIAETETEAALENVLRNNLSGALSTLKPLKDELSDHLKQARDVASPLKVDASWKAVAYRIREATDEAVRPLSHELWSTAESTYPNPQLREILIDTLRSPTASALPAAAIVIIGYLRAALTSFGVGAGIVVTIVLAAVIGGLLHAVTRVQTKHRGSIAFWVVFAVAQIAGLMVVLSGNGLEADVPPTELVGSILAMTISILVPSAVVTLNGARAHVLTRLHSHAAQQRIAQVARSRFVARVAREAAKHMHGTVQTSLIACAASMELAAKSDDPEQMVAAMTRALDVIGSAASVNLSPTSTMQEIVDSVASAWFGIADIHVCVDDRIADMTGQMADTAGRVVEECLSNAVRHGDAMSVRVQVEASHGGLLVTVEDDGLGNATTPFTAGVGTAMLIEASGGSVTFEAVSPGSDRPGMRVQAMVSPSSPQ